MDFISLLLFPLDISASITNNIFVTVMNDVTRQQVLYGVGIVGITACSNVTTLMTAR